MWTTRPPRFNRCLETIVVWTSLWPRSSWDGSWHISSTRSTCELRAQDLAELFPLPGCWRIPSVAGNAETGYPLTWTTYYVLWPEGDCVERASGLERRLSNRRLDFLHPASLERPVRFTSASGSVSGCGGVLMPARQAWRLTPRQGRIRQTSRHTACRGWSKYVDTHFATRHPPPPTTFRSPSPAQARTVSHARAKPLRAADSRQ